MVCGTDATRVRNEGGRCASAPLDGAAGLVAIGRISVFDYVIGSVPFKRQILNQLAGWRLRKLDDIGIPHHLLSVPHPNMSIVRHAAAPRLTNIDEIVALLDG
jgi:phosphoribosylaminoimidazole-succinocarboxamide synthase